MEKISEQIKKIKEYNILLKILYVLGILIIAKLIFLAGVTVGFHKASFGRAWEEHYSENFGMGRNKSGYGRMGGMAMPGMNYFPNAHGATGKIIKIELPNLIMQDKDNTEKIIMITAGTKIEAGRDDITPVELKVDDFLIVIGTPNESGTMEAKLIRVIPRPELLQ